MGTIVTDGGSTIFADDYASAAATPDGKLLVAYVPPDHTGTITIDMATLSGPARARWFNPTTAAYTVIAENLPNIGTHVFLPPGDNGSGFSDWVLVIDRATSIPTVSGWGATLLALLLLLSGGAIAARFPRSG
jgi:hypothetical protein